MEKVKSALHELSKELFFHIHEVDVWCDKEVAQKHKDGFRLGGLPKLLDEVKSVLGISDLSVYLTDESKWEDLYKKVSEEISKEFSVING